MVNFTQGDIFAGGHEAIVCTVNTVGVMGKGVALDFKNRLPGHCKTYFDACKRGDLGPGGVLISGLNNPRVLFAATKFHWRNPSEYEWVWLTMTGIKGLMRQHNIQDIGIPALGCGNGGLDWVKVREGAKALFSDMSDRKITFYEPGTTHTLVA